MPARAVDAQFLGALGDRVVVLLQLVFVVTRLEETLHAAPARDVLNDRADQDRHRHHQEHRPRQHRQVAHATEGHGQGNRQRRKGESEVADGVDVVGQHRNQPMAAVALDLLDRRREDFFAQFFAQLGDDVLADEIGADVGKDRAGQRQQAQAGKHRDHRAGQCALGVQHVVDGRQQRGDAQATDHAEQDRHADDQSKGFEQGEQFIDHPACWFAHGGSLLEGAANTGTARGVHLDDVEGGGRAMEDRAHF